MDHHLVRVIHALCEDVGTPVSQYVKTLVDHGEWRKLVEFSIKPSDYPDSESYFRDALVVDLLRKADFDTGIDKKQVAIDTFWSCEAHCAYTNARLNRYLPRNLLLETAYEASVYDFICRWRKEIDNVLRNLPDVLTPRFSGGATYADKGVLTTTPDKMSSTPTVTADARCLLPFWEETIWARGLREERPRQSPATVRGNRFTAVPKNGKTYRGICIEPSINITLQLDVGRVMKTRLKSHLGIDLLQGQDLHRELARVSSVTGKLATIDMRNASDTVCRVLPEIVLPTQWFQLCNSLRSGYTEIQPGKWVRLEKFSSMGNGFTFELETLLFCTLARTVCSDLDLDPSAVKAYGDDLIVPTAAAERVLNALEYFGFEANREKTFVKGRFRESCGGDFFDGVPVRAHFLKELPDEPQDWIALANGLRRVAGPDVHDGSRWSYVRRAWLRALDPIPSDIRRCRGPQHLGDIVIHDSEDRFYSNVGVRVYREPGSIYDRPEPVLCVRAYVPKPTVLPWHHWTPATQLSGCTLGLPSDGVTPRDSISGYGFRWTPFEVTSKWLPRTS